MYLNKNVTSAEKKAQEGLTVTLDVFKYQFGDVTYKTWFD